MNDKPLDQILSTEEELAPSSGFVAAVMDRVREEAAAPAPIAFPWKRVLPCVILAAIALLWGAVELVRQTFAAVQASAASQPAMTISPSFPVAGAGWIALALAVSLVCWLVSRRIAGESGLL